jgi:hypothetical protein
MARQLVDGGDVVHIAGEAHDVSPARLGPESGLQRSHRRERVEDLLGGRRALGPCPHLCQCAGVDEAVLAHLELGEMKSECLHLPDQVLELAIRQPRSTGGGQGCLHCAQIV